MNMKCTVHTILLCCTALVLLSENTEAQFAGTVSLYSDAAFSQTHAFDTGPGLLTVYVVHDNNPTDIMFLGGEFRVKGSPGFTGVWLGITSPHPYAEGNQGGLIIWYAGCTATPTHLLTITYALSGTSAPDSYLATERSDPLGIPMQLVTCDRRLQAVRGGRLVINPRVPTGILRGGTWGAIKSLYSKE